MECGPIIFEANARSIAAKTGPGYLHQQRRILMQAYAALLDAERSSA